MEINPSSSPPSNPSHDPNPAVDDNDDVTDDVTSSLKKLQLDQNNNDSDSDDEFTFMCVISDGDDDDDESVTTESDKSGNNRRHPVFPLFDQSLLLTNEDICGGGDRDCRLASHVPVNKVFIETESGSYISKEEEEKPSSSSSDSSNINIKSNSTGFSKLWRFRNEMNRSHSDGRDAYVFLQSPNNREDNNKGKTSLLNLNDVVLTKGMKPNDVVGEGEGKGKKVAVVKKVKKSTGSAHEVYLKQKKGGRTEEERRRSYLPYRPGLMGFFTNVNGGLSKNVHPF